MERERSVERWTHGDSKTERELETGKRWMDRPLVGQRHSDREIGGETDSKTERKRHRQTDG